MGYKLIQVTATKGENFALCSNLSLMDSQKLTPEAAVTHLENMAASYAKLGYNILWTVEDMGDDEVAIWGELFDRAAAY